MTLPDRLQQDIRRQEENLLVRGQPPRDRFDTLRQRHIWSDYHFVSGTGLAIRQDAGTGNVPVLQSEIYRVFTNAAGQAGQGLPAGFQLTQLDTNFIGSGRVPDQQNFAVWELGVSVLEQRADVVLASPTTRGAGQPHPDDVDKFLTECIVRIKAISQVVPLGHAADFCEPGAPSMVAPSLLDYSATGVVAAGPPAGGVGGMGAGSITAQPWSLQVPHLSSNGGGGVASPGSRLKLDVPIFLPAQTQFEIQLVIKRPFVLRSLQNGGTCGFRVRVDFWAAESYRPNS